MALGGGERQQKFPLFDTIARVTMARGYLCQEGDLSKLSGDEWEIAKSERWRSTLINNNPHWVKLIRNFLSSRLEAARKRGPGNEIITIDEALVPTELLATSLESYQGSWEAPDVQEKLKEDQRAGRFVETVQNSHRFSFSEGIYFLSKQSSRLRGCHYSCPKERITSTIIGSLRYTPSAALSVSGASRDSSHVVIVRV